MVSMNSPDKFSGPVAPTVRVTVTVPQSLLADLEQVLNPTGAMKLSATALIGAAIIHGRKTLMDIHAKSIAQN